MNYSSLFSGKLLAGEAPSLSDLRGFSPAHESGLIKPAQEAVKNNGDILEHSFFTDAVPQLIDYILQFSAGIAVLMIVVGGVMIMLGGEDEEYKSRGITTITWAIAGLIIATLAYVIVEIVNRISVSEGNPEVDVFIDNGHGIANLAGGNLLTEIIPRIIQIILQITGAIALGLLMYAGALMVMRDADDEKVTKARTLMLYALIGVVVSVLAYVIIEGVLLINFT